MAAIRHIFISPGHNYVGHHGQPSGEHEIVEVPEVECFAGRGLGGDRYLDFKPDFKGQITFFAWEVFEELESAYGSLPLGPASMRRNVITEGIDLNALIGVEFEVAGLRFAGTQESAPCYWMEEAVGEGAEAFLKGKGGLRARILSDGFLRPGPCSWSVCK